MVPLVPFVDWAAWSILARPGPEDPWVKTKLSPLARYNEETFYDLPPSTCYLLGREEVASCMNMRRDPLHSVCGCWSLHWKNGSVMEKVKDKLVAENHYYWLK